MKVYGPEAIRRAIGFTDLIEPVAQVFAEFSKGIGEAPGMVFTPAGDQGDVHVKSAWLPGRSVFTVKVAAWFAARAADGRPPGSGFVAVHDATTGDLRALLLDESHLTDIRTAAAGAVATRLLARENATAIAVLGTGVQAYLQVLAARAVRPIDTVIVWGRRAEAARTLCAALEAAAPTLSVSMTQRAEQAVERADVIVTATASRTPILYGHWLRPGQHVTGVGADDVTKAELDPTCFHRADVLAVDSRLNPSVAAEVEIGELLLGHRPGRRDPSQITVARLVGLGVQDLAAAETALRLLEGDRPAGTRPPASALDLT
ncbi:ornithine cyclodeaminase family protein [Nonomuraea sp. NPDC026600]|uniref:ornithine cyclodeaminase family protein n=1 Tax=Nonomuraea sp. NPDC026600 TaxID=3155363 RepID=UPI0033D7E5A9